ncbi:MAG: trypsin-like serine peptidase [Halioglobus sp.]
MRLSPFAVPLLTTLLTITSHSSVADDRVVFDGKTPVWLAAIGTLEVPGSRYTAGRREHFTEDCSATLVRRHGEGRANTVLTAWHCLEKYSDLSKAIRFTLRTSAGNVLSLEAYIVRDGGSIESDWAMLRLYESVAREDVRALHINTNSVDMSRHIVMAGFSRDAGLGAGGTRLTYDPACRVTSAETHANATDCYAYKGASGGPVIQVDSAGVPAVYGVISEGDGVGYSTFVPASTFRSAVRELL